MRKLRIFLVLFPIISFAQIGINTTTPKAALDVESSDNGILIPRVQLLNDLDITTILNPNGGALETSTMVYNIAPSGTAPNYVEAGFYYWNGTKWKTISGNATNSWSLEGNAGTNPATLFGSNFVAGENFIGTTDYEDLLLGTNNRPIMKISDFGNIGIGVDNPNAKLHINDNSSYITSWITKTNVDNGFGGYVSPTLVVNTTSTLSEANETNYNAQFFSGGTNIGTNVAALFAAAGGANNYAIVVPENSGNVGIGTSTPTEKLHVFSNLDIDKSSIFGTSTQVSTSADFLNVGVKGNGNGSGSFGFGVGILGTTDVNSTWNSTGVYAQLGAVNPTFSSSTSSNQALVANGNGFGRAAMFLGGNVGIGLPLTTNPSSLLHINSATNGAVRIVDGTEGNGKILTSNATGVATWQNQTPSGFTHYLGELYLGGIIFELYKGSDGLEHGLFVSLTESGLTAWQTPTSITGANRSEDGAYNTALMTSSPVATYIASLGTGWYLPSIDELNILFNNRYYANKALRLGGYTLLSISRLYWSSTELDIASASALNFGLGTFYYETKSDTNYARGIRQF